MSRPLRRLLPADEQRNADNIRFDREPGFQSRKRRKHVLVACNNCRTSKAACDGIRPSCVRCARLDLVCEYVSTDETETPSQALKNQILLLQQQLKKQADMLEQLRLAPEEEALTSLRTLRGLTDPGFGLASMSEDLLPTVNPSELETIAEPPSTKSALDLGPYVILQGDDPALASIDLALIDLAPIDLGPYNFSGLRQTSPRNASTRESQTPGPSKSVQRDDVVPYSMPGAGMSSSESSGDVSAPKYHYCDTRLQKLKVGYWTKVSVSDEIAASAISLYLETDHPLLGFFDADLVICDLVGQRIDFCSPFLASSLLYLAFQSYAVIDDRATPVSIEFFKEAEKLWFADRLSTDPSTLAAKMILGLAGIYSGKKKLVFEIFSEVRQAATKLYLFGVPQTDASLEEFQSMSPDRIREVSHVAWGAFNFLTLHSLYFRRKPIRHPPGLPMPGDFNDDHEQDGISDWPAHPLPSYMGNTFPSMCRLWVLVDEVATKFYTAGKVPVSEGESLVNKELKYQKLVEWAGTLAS